MWPVLCLQVWNNSTFCFLELVQSHRWRQVHTMRCNVTYHCPQRSSTPTVPPSLPLWAPYIIINTFSLRIWVSSWLSLLLYNCIWAHVWFLTISDIQSSSVLAEAIKVIGRLQPLFFSFDSHSLALLSRIVPLTQCEAITVRLSPELHWRNNAFLSISCKRRLVQVSETWFEKQQRWKCFSHKWSNCHI